MHQAVTKGGAVSWLLLVFDKEDNVEEVCGDQGKVEAKDCCPANLEEESLFFIFVLREKYKKHGNWRHLGFHVSRNLHSRCSSTKAECIKNNQPGQKKKKKTAWSCFFFSNFGTRAFI